MDPIEQKIIQLIEEHREDIIQIGRSIWEYPELGYKEFRTSKLFTEFMEKFGLPVERGLAITGAKAYLKDRNMDGPTIALIGEMDALPMADSPYANPETGAAHCCGHNAQMAGMMGALFALSDPEIKEALDGNVVFFAVPSEEYVEMEFKHNLMKEGKIRYGGGKSELIRLGAFDDIHIAVGHHIAPETTVSISNHKTTGFLSKLVRYEGISSHAADAPERGVDALNAVNLALHALQLQQESYRDQDTVRVHGYISNGGEAMNIIADTAVMEYSVRANNIPAIEDADRKFDRSIRAGADATGCGASIITMPGYLPTIPVKDTRAIQEAAAEGAGSYPVMEEAPGKISGGSTDFGDVSHLLPLLQFNTGGYSCELHNKQTHPVDEYLAYVVTAKIFALTAYKLLKNKADYGNALIKSCRPAMTKEQYLHYMEAHNETRTIPMEPVILKS